ncbi:RNA pol II transcription cofactor [Naganishia albida]|nr:RNA pol II transcription cofactor [Naganishia albida]
MSTQTSRKAVKSVLAIEQSEGVGAKVRRSIGSPALRNLTPFLMLDHFTIGKGAGFADHPHRGQSTVTYMLEGKVQHEDFAGHAGTIGPGDLQWMVAGKGIMHAEMPLHEEGKPDPMGLQLWIDLPAKDKGIDPLYQEMLAKDICTVRPSEDVEITVISGESHGEKGPVRPVGGCWYLDFKLKGKGAKVFQPLPKGWTSFLYLLSGGLIVGDQPDVHKAYHTVVLSAGEGENGVWLQAAEDGLTRGVLIAGEPLQQRVVQYGPFVTTSTDEARQAIMDFQNAENGFERAKHWRSEIGKPLTNRAVR